MEIEDRKEILKLGKDLIKWANRVKEQRIRYAKATYELSVIVASKNIEERLSFENKVLKLLNEDTNLLSLYNDYVQSYQMYKSAELMFKAVESNINSIKFINRIII